MLMVLCTRVAIIVGSIFVGYGINWQAGVGIAIIALALFEAGQA